MNLPGSLIYLSFHLFIFHFGEGTKLSNRYLPLEESRIICVHVCFDVTFEHNILT